MWFKWLPWKFILKRVARAQGFLDPIVLLSHFNRFAQPSEVLAPVELMRAGAVLHARGLINSQVIQHNLDWVWPYWAERQFDPRDPSFIPRAFSLTHINLTHRNWTAVGIPGLYDTPLLDPRGLLMPFFDSWSLDFWIVSKDGHVKVIPSQMHDVEQKITCQENICITTHSHFETYDLTTRVYADFTDGKPSCVVDVQGKAPSESWLVIALRPYNPEGISFIHSIDLMRDLQGWKINGNQYVHFKSKPNICKFSHYTTGDVFHWMRSLTDDKRKTVTCDVGMATGMVAYSLTPGEIKNVSVSIPFDQHHKKLLSTTGFSSNSVTSAWTNALAGSCQMHVDGLYKDLFNTAIHTIVLHSPSEVYAGPYTYKRFWFRDAVLIGNALLCTGHFTRMKQIIERFFPRQNMSGYFVSQEGEWDSNGQVLWILQQYCLFTNTKPEDHWRDSVVKACQWIVHKRLSPNLKKLHAGLLPAGFSAEHLGPNDHYYWDNFWSVAGLRSGAWLIEQYGEKEISQMLKSEADSYMECIEQSLKAVAGPMRRPAMPASPYRRLDSGAVGSLVAGYPLQLWAAEDLRLHLTAEYLFDNCLIDGAFYHDISHSGINPYLTLHIAQVMLRAGDQRYKVLVDAICKLASPTGQWPEAIHPQLKTGCMGDGQHVWAAAEWIMIMRNCFVNEDIAKKIVLCAGIDEEMYKDGKQISFGPAPTVYGSVTVHLKKEENGVRVKWNGLWHNGAPEIEIALPGFSKVVAPSDHQEILLQK